jgi:hypothetical protein
MRYRVFKFDKAIADTGRSEQTQFMTATYWAHPARRAGIVAWMLEGLARVVENGLIEPESMKVAKDQALNAWRNQPQDASTYGILSRVQALHAYTSENTIALVAWLVFLTLVLFLELMVVFSKLVFAETVDDELDAIREKISQRKARDYQEAVTSPLASAQNLVQASYS